MHGEQPFERIELRTRGARPLVDLDLREDLAPRFWVYDAARHGARTRPLAAGPYGFNTRARSGSV